MRNTIKALWVYSLCLLGVSGCVSTRKDHYYWGNYEQLIYDMYVKPGTADAVVQIEKLTLDIQKAQSVDKPIPPGVYAHLGFMYTVQGSVVQALEAFNEEKALYPESAVLIDGMLKRLTKAGKENR